MTAFWFKKDRTLFPHLSTIYPVSNEYSVNPDYLSNRYKTPKVKKGS